MLKNGQLFGKIHGRLTMGEWCADISSYLVDMTINKMLCNLPDT